jgi:hypothetical protein
MTTYLHVSRTCPTCALPVQVGVAHERENAKTACTTPAPFGASLHRTRNWAVGGPLAHIQDDDRICADMIQNHKGSWAWTLLRKLRTNSIRRTIPPLSFSNQLRKLAPSPADELKARKSFRGSIHFCQPRRVTKNAQMLKKQSMHYFPAQTVERRTHEILTKKKGRNMTTLQWRPCGK